jgi:hypothetical protein
MTLDVLILADKNEERTTSGTIIDIPAIITVLAEKGYAAAHVHTMEEALATLSQTQPKTAWIGKLSLEDDARYNGEVYALSPLHAAAPGTACFTGGGPDTSWSGQRMSREDYAQEMAYELAKHAYVAHVSVQEGAAHEAVNKSEISREEWSMKHSELWHERIRLEAEFSKKWYGK